MKITGHQGTPSSSTALTNPTEVGGDLSGTIPDNATVVGIGNVPISGLPSDGDTIVYDVTTNTYIFEPGGAAASDVFDAEPQVVQSKRYLMRDGTWRDPLLVGTGAISVGSISTITNDTKYNAWPAVCRMQDGRLIVAYTKGDSHHADNTGKAVVRIGTEALGGGITWDSEITAHDDASVWVSACGVTSLESGRVIVTTFIGNFSSNPLDGANLVYSDDFGATWSAPVVVNSGLTDYSYMSGPVCQLQDGTLRVLVEGENSGDTFSRMRVLTSTDDGETWGSEVEIATGTRNYYEGCLVLLDDDTLIALMRTTDAAGDTYSSTSTDGGATWTAPALAYAGHARPHTVQLSTGTLISITRENAGVGEGDVWAYTSTDRGATWGSVTTLDGTMYEMEYGCPVELFDGRVLVVYGYQPTSSTTNADIKQVYVTETIASVGTLTVKEEGVALATGATSLDFVGANVTATGAGAAKTITIEIGPQHAHLDNVVFSGDGATTAWVLPVAPVDATSVAAYIAGVRTQDWTLSGALLDTITFGSAPASAADNIVIDITAAVA